MNTLIILDEFYDWIYQLKDSAAKNRILVRIQRAKKGNFGNAKAISGGIFEMKIDAGPGYRVYCSKKEYRVYWILHGGNKSTQVRDIRETRNILKRIREK